MRMWEYAYDRITDNPEHDRRWLNERGGAGWELVGMNTRYYWFKRIVPGTGGRT